MEVYIRKRKSGPPFEAIAAFFFGIAIGFGVSYFLFGGKGIPAAPPVDQVASTQTEPVTTPPSEEPATPAPTDTPATPTETTAPPPPTPGPPATTPAPTDALANLEDVWPARHLFIAVKGEKLDNDTKEMLAELKPGGVLLRSENVKVRNQLDDLIAEIKSVVGLGTTIDSLPLIAVAQEGGALNVLNLKDAPPAAKIGSARDLTAAKTAGANVGKSCADRKIGVLLAPVLDVYAKGAPKEIQARCFGEDHKEVAAIGMAFADGVVSAGILPVAKHFPGMGTIKGDTLKTLPTLTEDLNRMSQLMLPFNEAATCDVPGILIGHVVVPALDNETKPIASAAFSTKFTKLLRETWGYPGVILADDVNRPAITKSLPLEKAVVTALAAGSDAVLMLHPDPEKVRMVCTSIEKAVADGALNRAALSESKRRLDVWQQALKAPKPGLEGPLPELPGAAPKETAQPAPAVEPAQPAAEIEYTVVGGDNISKIANKFKVKAEDIKSWNNLPSDNLSVGQKIIIKTTQPTPAPAEIPAPAASQPSPAPTETTTEPPSEEPAVQPPANTKAVSYVVKSGDYLSSIATRHKVTYQEIMSWNHLNDTQLKVGQTLTIYVPESFVLPEEPAAPTSPGVKPAAETKPEAKKSEEANPAPTPEAPKTEASSPPGDMEITYTVKRGDNLANIAAKYGVTADDIRGWNGIEGNRIDVDQQLKIRPKKMPSE